VQVGDVLRDHLALEVLPGTPADAIARIDRLRATHGLGAQICAPGLPASPCRGGELLAVAIRALQSAEVAALAARIAAGDEKRHARRLWRLRRRGRRLLCLREYDYARRNERNRCQQRYSGVHYTPPFTSRWGPQQAFHVLKQQSERPVRPHR